MDHKKELMKLFKALAPKYSLFKVFGDFCRLGAITISNGIDKAHYDKREAMYMQTISKYTKEEANGFARMLASLTLGLQKNRTDLLGEVFMELEISNKDQGQFFTPIDVAELMAEVSIEGVIKEIDTKGCIHVNDPTVGGGVTIIALANALEKRGYNYQKCMKVVVQDIDMDLVHMCYLQFSLLGIDAVIMRGDTLAYEFDSFWYTPIHILNKVDKKDAEQREARTIKMVEAMKRTVNFEAGNEIKMGQLTLF